MGSLQKKKDVVTNVRGVNELKYCFRSDFKVRDLAQSFQKNIFQDKYDIDDMSENETFFGQTLEKEGYINYMLLSSNNRDRVVALYNIIRGNILNKNSNISPNDITILGYTTKLLRIFDAYYRHASHEKTNSMLETIEVMYMVHLNFLGKNLQETNSNYGWFKNITKHFQQKIFPNRSRLYDNDYITIRQHIAKLFTIYDLYETYSDTFETNMNEVCIRCHIPLKAFKAFREHYKEALSQFKNEVYSDNYKSIRDNKKLEKSEYAVTVV